MGLEENFIEWSAYTFKSPINPKLNLEWDKQDILTCLLSSSFSIQGRKWERELLCSRMNANEEKVTSLHRLMNVSRNEKIFSTRSLFF